MQSEVSQAARVSAESALVNLYRDLTVASRANWISADGLDLIRLSRSTHAYAALPDDAKQPYLDALKEAAGPDPEHRDTTTTILEDLTVGASQEKTKRLLEFVSRFGLLIFAVCAHTPTFRNLLSDFTESGTSTLVKFLDYIDPHSIELFARTRGCRWDQALTHHDDKFQDLSEGLLYNLLSQHSTYTEKELFGASEGDKYIRHDLHGDNLRPHEWALAGEEVSAYRPVVNVGRMGRTQLTKQQVDINASILDESEVWRGQKKWPIADPRYRTARSDGCEICGDVPKENRFCGCTLDDLDSEHESLFNPRIELVRYADRGIGIRALQPLKDGDIIGEYVGELLPKNQSKYKDNVDYLYTQDPGLAPPDQNEKRLPHPLVVNIDPIIYGNWTRYLKHSCASHSVFERHNVGNKLYTLIRVRKKVEYGEEITINYGRGYFDGKGYGCRCGYEKCLAWDGNNPTRNEATLASALEDGSAPDWANSGQLMRRHSRISVLTSGMVDQRWGGQQLGQGKGQQQQKRRKNQRPSLKRRLPKQ